MFTIQNKSFSFIFQFLIKLYFFTFLLVIQTFKMLSHLNILEIIVIFFVFLAIDVLINFLGSRVRIHLTIWALVILNFLLLSKFMAIWLIAELIITVCKLFRWGHSWSVECLLRSFKSFGVKIFWTAFSFQILDV